ncbi:hypothetical protein Amn_37140 [Aminobacter sp. Y103A]|nr:hypothetical protein Amn_37140 [Aminobacter sp. SS-2016]
MKTLNEIFEHTLEDMYFAENAITKALPKVAKAAKDAKLKKAAEESSNRSSNRSARRHRARNATPSKA